MVFSTPQERIRAINRGLSEKLEKQVVAIMNEVRWSNGRHVEEWRFVFRSFHDRREKSVMFFFFFMVLNYSPWVRWLRPTRCILYIAELVRGGLCLCFRCLVAFVVEVSCCDGQSANDLANSLTNGLANGLANALAFHVTSCQPRFDFTAAGRREPTKHVRASEGHSRR